MMSLENFKVYMLEIQKYLENADKASNALQVLANSSFIVVDFADPLMSRYIKLLSESVGDESEWIDWFIFENDFGKGGMEAGQRDDMHLIDTIEKLYDLIRS